MHFHLPGAQRGPKAGPKGDSKGDSEIAICMEAPKIAGVTLKPTSEIKILGMIVDDSLSFDHHIKEVGPAISPMKFH